MDLIAGIVVSTSVFLFSTALVALFARLPVGEPHRGQELELRAIVHKLMATSLIVYFVALLDLLLVAQQMSLALGTFVVGVVLLVVFYVEPAVRSRRDTTREADGWES